jgi:hypothetical protein
MFPDDVTGCKECGTSNSFEGFNPFCSFVSVMEVQIPLGIFITISFLPQDVALIR